MSATFGFRVFFGKVFGDGGEGGDQVFGGEDGDVFAEFGSGLTGGVHGSGKALPGMAQVFAGGLGNLFQNGMEGSGDGGVADATKALLGQDQSQALGAVEAQAPKSLPVAVQEPGLGGGLPRDRGSTFIAEKVDVAANGAGMNFQAFCQRGTGTATVRFELITDSDQAAKH